MTLLALSVSVMALSLVRTLKIKQNAYKYSIMDPLTDAINDENVDLGTKCPPACSETVYSASMSSVPLASKLSESSTALGESLVRVFFQESSIVKLKRDQLYAPEDIICKHSTQSNGHFYLALSPI